MTFKQFIVEEEVSKISWGDYVEDNPMLKVALEVIEILSKHGKAYIVGGAVRDIIMGKPPKDIDIASNIPMEKIEELFDSHDIGKNKQFNIVVIDYKGFTFEVAHFRTDGTYSDGRRPETVEIVTDFKDDASRRDFSVNAMAIDKDGNVIDYFDGQGDIKNKILRTVGNPDNRFSEDFLRMLRAIRFSSRMDFTINDDVKEAIKKNAEKIMKIAPERVTGELLKMAEQSGMKFAKAIESMKELDILKYIIPEVDKLSSMKHNKNFHPEGDTVFIHVIEALKSYTGNDPFVNMSLLFHDIGKLTTYDEAGGKHSYHGHDKAGLELIDVIAQRMKFDNNLKSCLKFCAEKHMNMHNITQMSKNKIINLMSNPFWNILVTVAECDSKARGSLFSQKDWDNQMLKIAEIKDKYGSSNPEDKIKKSISGQLIMDTLNIKPSAEIGIIQKKAIEKAIEDNIDLNNVEQIKEIIKSVSISK